MLLRNKGKYQQAMFELPSLGNPYLKQNGICLVNKFHLITWWTQYRSGLRSMNNPGGGSL